MQKIKLDSEHEGIVIKDLNIFLDDEGDLIVLPSLFATHLALTEQIYKFSTTRIESAAKSRMSVSRKTTKVFSPVDISQNTVKQYLSCIYRLLKHINSNLDLSVHQTEDMHTRFLNQYLNEDVGTDMNIGDVNTIIKHQSAISAYCNFLSAIGIWHPNETRDTTIYPSTKAEIRKRGTGPSKIKYIPIRDRQLLVSRCKTQRDRLLIKMGYLVGLRAQENCALTLMDRPSKAGQKPKPGLLSLFDEMNNTNSDVFSFYLTTHAKTDYSNRDVYFTRELLSEIHHYYETERAITLEGKPFCDSLFVRDDNAGRGMAITVGCPSDVFSSIRSKLPHLQETLSYHDLRHSFATDLYYDEIHDNNGREVGNSSAARIVVGKRLGHAPGKDGTYPATSIYVRLKIEKEKIESTSALSNTPPPKATGGCCE